MESVLGPIVDRIATRLSVFKHLLEIPATRPIMAAHYEGKYVYNHNTAATTSLKKYGSKSNNHHPKAIPATTQQLAKGKAVEVTDETKGEKTSAAACKEKTMDLYQLVVNPLLVMRPGERAAVLAELRQFAATLDDNEREPESNVEQLLTDVFTRNGKLVESVREAIAVEQILRGKRLQALVKGKKREDARAKNRGRTQPCETCFGDRALQRVQNCVEPMCCWPFFNLVCGHYFLSS